MLIVVYSFNRFFRNGADMELCDPQAAQARR